MKNIPDEKDVFEPDARSARVPYQVPALEELGVWQYATGFTFKVGSILPGQDSSVWGARPWSLEEENRR